MTSNVFVFIYFFVGGWGGGGEGVSPYLCKLMPRLTKCVTNISRLIHINQIKYSLVIAICSIVAIELREISICCVSTYLPRPPRYAASLRALGSLDQPASPSWTCCELWDNVNTNVSPMEFHVPFALTTTRLEHNTTILNLLKIKTVLSNIEVVETSHYFRRHKPKKRAL